MIKITCRFFGVTPETG